MELPSTAVRLNRTWPNVHRVIDEHIMLKNRSTPNYSNAFAFGMSELIKNRDVVPKLRDLFERHTRPSDRPVLFDHTLKGDLRWLQQAYGWNVPESFLVADTQLLVARFRTATNRYRFLQTPPSRLW